MTPDRWLLWFLQAHDNAPLIQAGLWKRAALVVKSLGDEAAAVVEVAYRTGGTNAAWQVVIDSLNGVDVANVPIQPEMVHMRPVANRPMPGTVFARRRKDY